MIWPIVASFVWISECKNTIIISTKFTIRRDIANIVLIAIIVMTLNHLMTMKESTEMERKALFIAVIVGLTVSISFVSDSPFYYLVLMEITVIPLGHLIIISSKDKDKLESIKFIVMINTLGSVPFIVYVILREELSRNYLEISIRRKRRIALLTLFLVKTPVFLTHMWLTKAHVSASGNCSMILARVMIKIGTVGIYKFCKTVRAKEAIPVVTALGVVGALYISTIMFRFFDSKSLVALSSVLHISLLVPIISLGKSLTIISSLIIITAHGLISYFLFYLITIKYEMVERRTSLAIKARETSDKLFAILISIFALINLGVPPIINFISECIFMHSLRMINSIISKRIFILILLLRVIFTLQLITNNLFGSTKRGASKIGTVSITIKSRFFGSWTLIIIAAI